MSAQCIIWNKNLPYLSQLLFTDTYALASLLFQETELGKTHVAD